MGQVARGADWFVLCVYISPRRRYGEVPIGDPGAVTSALLLVATLVLLASAQIIVLPREPHIPIVRSFQVRQIDVDSQIQDQMVQVQFSQTFNNPSHTVTEAEYLFPFPDEDACTTAIGMRGVVRRQLFQMDSVSGRSAVWQWRGKQIFKSAGSLADPHHRQRRVL